MEIRKNSRRRSRSSDYVELGHFTFFAEYGKEMYKFGGVLVAVVVVVCLALLGRRLKYRSIILFKTDSAQSSSNKCKN